MELWLLNSTNTDNCTYSNTETLMIGLTEKEVIKFKDELKNKELYGKLTIEKVITGVLL